MSTTFRPDNACTYPRSDGGKCWNKAKDGICGYHKKLKTNSLKKCRIRTTNGYLCANVAKEIYGNKCYRHRNVK